MRELYNRVCQAGMRKPSQLDCPLTALNMFCKLYRQSHSLQTREGHTLKTTSLRRSMAHDSYSLFGQKEGQ